MTQGGSAATEGLTADDADKRGSESGPRIMTLNRPSPTRGASPLPRGEGRVRVRRVSITHNTLLMNGLRNNAAARLVEKCLIYPYYPFNPRLKLRLRRSPITWARTRQRFFEARFFQLRLFSLAFRRPGFQPQGGRYHSL